MNNFERQCAEENPIVKAYFDENMTFEAWTIIIRETNLKDGQDLYNELEKVVNRKTIMTDEEKESLDYEFWDFRNCKE